MRPAEGFFVMQRGEGGIKVTPVAIRGQLLPSSIFFLTRFCQPRCSCYQTQEADLLCVPTPGCSRVALMQRHMWTSGQDAFWHRALLHVLRGRISIWFCWCEGVECLLGFPPFMLRLGSDLDRQVRFQDLVATFKKDLSHDLHETLRRRHELVLWQDLSFRTGIFIKKEAGVCVRVTRQVSADLSFVLAGIWLYDTYDTGGCDTI